jgi:S1-C subfamily serine protease
MSNALARTWTVAIIAGIVGAMAASGVGMLTGAFEQSRSMVVDPTLVSEPTQSPVSSAASIDWNGVDQNVAPSVVAIGVSTPSGPASASGVMLERYGQDAYVVTDSAVVAQGGSVQVSFLSGGQTSGRVIGADPGSGLALIAVSNLAPYFPTVGTVADVRDADPVLAVGARTSTGGSVFSGSVSGEDREVTLTGGSTMQNLIAVSSSPPLTASAAGGPLVDQSGRVVGITLNLNPVDTADQNLTFAVPIDVARSVVQQLLAGDCCTHPWLGVSDGVTVPTVVAHQLGLTGGVSVGDVSPDSPASRMGVAQNDIITTIGNQPVTTSGMLTKVLAECRPGVATDITFVRNGKQVQGRVVLADQPPSDPDNS